MFTLSFWVSSLLTVLNIWGCVDTQDLLIDQLSSSVTATIGDSAKLPCRLKDELPIGPVKWFKGTKPNRQLIYSDKQPNSRVQKVMNTNLVWDICISNITHQDEGVYYCVKFKKESEEEWQSGRGTQLNIAQSPGSSGVLTAAAMAGSVALILILLVLCYYFKRSKGPSPCLARPETSKKNQSQREPTKDKEIVYADLQHVGKNHQPASPAQGAGLHSEYATIHI